ncbi:MAG: dephospho-CoA kinase [Rhizobiales bacterium]|nr:dephospho-CoA kinase [Hyphomicrobiales bacterium]MBO6699501.1 dephospho-CoA kinase [Hyphomicrobiales bacterium]MBO6737039.1 dephospho-CoA kinase [Hyphomicrobiales bacterium]MBO6911887.1 dephospho-CoA kinase [Hyphomicrobiales bacterium]MBO6954823.1 dephospho-CoA kinase [Hyphomicrobiales bacterium]
MISVGLTGSIATGKSTTAQLFADEGVPVHDADAAVHEIYRQEGVAPVGALIPGAIIGSAVDRAALKKALADDPSLFPKLEAIVHPLVQARERRAAADALADGHDVMVFDIPLLFETGSESRMDKVVVVHCDPQTQRARLLARPGMDEATASMLIDRQMPQVNKIARADFLVSTDHGVEAARDEVRTILAELRA